MSRSTNLSHYPWKTLIDCSDLDLINNMMGELIDYIDDRHNKFPNWILANKLLGNVFCSILQNRLLNDDSKLDSEQTFLLFTRFVKLLRSCFDNCLPPAQKHICRNQKINNDFFMWTLQAECSLRYKIIVVDTIRYFSCSGEDMLKSLLKGNKIHTILNLLTVDNDCLHSHILGIIQNLCNYPALLNKHKMMIMRKKKPKANAVINDAFEVLYTNLCKGIILPVSPKRRRKRQKRKQNPRSDVTVGSENVLVERDIGSLPTSLLIAIDNLHDPLVTSQSVYDPIRTTTISADMKLQSLQNIWYCLTKDNYVRLFGKIHFFFVLRKILHEGMERLMQCSEEDRSERDMLLIEYCFDIIAQLCCLVSEELSIEFYLTQFKTQPFYERFDVLQLIWKLWKSKFEIRTTILTTENETKMLISTALKHRFNMDYLNDLLCCFVDTPYFFPSTTNSFEIDQYLHHHFTNILIDLFLRSGGLYDSIGKIMNYIEPIVRTLSEVQQEKYFYINNNKTNFCMYRRYYYYLILDVIFILLYSFYKQYC